MKTYLVGCDIGTGGTKAILADTTGKVLGSHLVEYNLIIPRTGWAEQKPDWYWQGAAKAIKSSIEKARIDPANIAGVGLSSLAPACILIDREGHPLQNSHIWMDRRAQDECEWLRKVLDEEYIFELTGNLIDSYYSIPKLLWEKNNRTELYRRARWMLNVKDYVLLKMTGKALTDYSHAALAGVAFDIREKCWEEEILTEIGVDKEKLPSVYPCDEVIGRITKEASTITGLKEGTPVVAGGVDANSACLSTGSIDEGENALTLGSTGCWAMAHTREEFVPRLICMPHTAYSRTHYISLAALVGGGSLLRWFRDNFGQIERAVEKESGLDSYDILNKEAERIPSGSDGLLVLPYFMGERCPLWDPSARGVIFGLSFLHRRGHLIRAMMEGVGFAIRHNMDLFQERKIKPAPLMRLVEGGAKSSLWRQIIADITGTPVAYMGDTQGAPLGDVVMAGVGLGIFDRYEVIREWISPQARNDPDGNNRPVYENLFQKYLKLYPALKDLF